MDVPLAIFGATFDGARAVRLAGNKLLDTYLPLCD